jgi:small subunit ribosomal protein S6
MFIFDSNRFGRDPQAISGQIPQMVEEAGGEVLVSRLWEERRLAYPIAGHRKGTYWLSYFRLDPAQLKGIERKCRLSESIIRVLFLKVDPRIVDTLVAHALGGPTARSAEPAPVAVEAVGVDAVGLDDA